MFLLLLFIWLFSSGVLLVALVSLCVAATVYLRCPVSQYHAAVFHLLVSPSCTHSVITTPSIPEVPRCLLSGPPGYCCFSSVFLLNVFVCPSAFCVKSFSFRFFSFSLCLCLHLPFDNTGLIIERRSHSYHLYHC